MMPMSLTGFGAFTPAAVATALEWSPTDKNANYTLSIANTRAELGADTAAGIRSNTGKSTGKWFWEMEAYTGVTWNGFANSSASLSAFAPNSSAESVIARTNSSQWKVSDIAIGDYGSNTTQFGVFTYAVDFDAELMWVAIDGGNWNGSGTADPATGTEGWDFSSAGSGPWFVFYGGDGNGQRCDLRTTGTAKSLPSGFTAWS
jgi:hypothetical protein